MKRRTFFSSLAGALTLGSTVPALDAQTVQRKGRLKQGITGGCLRGLSFEDECSAAARLGVRGIDLVGPDRFAVLKKYGLIPTMLPSGSSIRDGIIHKELHEKIAERMNSDIDIAASAGAPNVIVLAGERKRSTDAAALNDAQGIENAVLFLNRVKRHAEDKGVTLCLELLNSKVNHPGYMCDHTAWGVEVCKQVNSPRVKLLYDIYHMQIMEGDIIRTIRENFQWIGHFHTAGNPGRNEFDDTQELNYRGICRALVDLGYQGYLVHEYGPKKGSEPVKTLDEMLAICDV
ncbi:MAG TPA: TIM barrel protein [Acidobacteriota bacterium]|nr:TIM barrel protein [Acidobacteriota bacterium]